MSDLRQIVLHTYRETVAAAPVRNELKEALKTSQRVPSFIESLTKELSNANAFQQAKTSRPFKLKTIKDTVKDMTLLFLQGIESEAKKRYESDMERIKREAEAQKLKDLDSTLNGKPQGEFAEMVEQGLTIGETITKAEA